MHSLGDLKALFESKGNFKILSFDGMFLYTIHGRWGMAHDEYFLNGQSVSRKEIQKSFLM